MSHTYSTPSAATYSLTYDTLDDMMMQLPNNTSNIISARKIRDSILTLWYKTDDLGLSFSSLSIPTFTNPTQSTTTVGGITIGSTFSNKTLQEMFDMLLYPYSPPVLSLSTSNSPREYGSGVSTTLSWDIIHKEYNIQSILVDGTIVAPTGYSQSGTKLSSVVQNVDTYFSMTASDGQTIISKSASVVWMNKIYWGISGPTLSSSEVIGLTGGGIGTGWTFSYTRVQNLDGIFGCGYYLSFAWPTPFGTPSFTVNGSLNTSFTKDTKIITNGSGYTSSYDVWTTNTPQNSPITYFKIN